MEQSMMGTKYTAIKCMAEIQKNEAIHKLLNPQEVSNEKETTPTDGEEVLSEFDGG